MIESAVNSITKDNLTMNSSEEKTYTSTKTSAAYTAAKALLASGEFETALETIEMALGAILSVLPDYDNSSSSSNSIPNKELHPSLAPLYYLYGSTLLYSVEESGDAVIPSNNVTEARPSPEDGNPAISNDNDADPATMSTHEVPSNFKSIDNTPNISNAEDQAEDVQIAWENLEMARSVLTDLHAKHPSSFLYTLDLAQVYQRLGDLQKGNGNYANAIHDYLTSLKLRMEALKTRYDRKIADCHYSLGMTYLLLASEVDVKEQQQKQRQDDEKKVGGSATGGGVNSINETDDEVLGGKEELRRKSILHYLTCGCTFAGLIGGMCGKEQDESALINVEGENMNDKWWEEEPKKMSANQEQSQTNENNQKYSLALKTVIERVKDYKAINPENGGIIFDYKELLDEIQETIDSSDESLKAVNDLSIMKTEREGEAEKEDAAALTAGIEASITGSSSLEAVGTTTIGFGNAASSASASASATINTITTSSVASASVKIKGANKTISTSNTGAPVMLVKKKKRLPPQSSTQPGDVSKRGKTE